MSREATLSRSVTEEQNRRKASFKEFKTLFDIYTKHIKTENTEKLKTTILNKLRELKKLISQFTASSESLTGSTYPFKTNKNAEILNCAHNFIAQHGFVTSWNQLMNIYPMSEESKTWLKLHNNDHKGTSAMNCVQAALYVTLTELNVVQELKDAQIYDVRTSPLVQTTALPSKATNQPLYSNVKQSLFFYKDELSPSQGELMFFSLGYSFGGSRADSRYHDKEFRTEDCSSCVAKWTDSKYPFITSTMKLIVQDQKACSQDTWCCYANNKFYIKGTDLNNSVLPGDIYVFQRGGHMGIVANIINSTCFESLTYSRVMPTQEGLGYNIDCLTERDYFFFGHVDDSTNSEL